MRQPSCPQIVSLLIRSFPYLCPALFRSVRDLGGLSVCCPVESGKPGSCSSVWLPAWLPPIVGPNCLDPNTLGLSVTAAHLDLQSERVRQHRPASVPVVVNVSGQQPQSYALTARYLLSAPVSGVAGCDVIAYYVYSDLAAGLLVLRRCHNRPRTPRMRLSDHHWPSLAGTNV
jgi:hypothetical protein